MTPCGSRKDWRFEGKYCFYLQCNVSLSQSLIILKIKVTCSSETSVLPPRATWHHIPEHNIVSCYRREKWPKMMAFLEPTLRNVFSVFNCAPLQVTSHSYCVGIRMPAESRFIIPHNRQTHPPFVAIIFTTFAVNWRQVINLLCDTMQSQSWLRDCCPCLRSIRAFL
jgi:hypothetical protein